MLLRKECLSSHESESKIMYIYFTLREYVS
jgi:hypothetical protein